MSGDQFPVFTAAAVHAAPVFLDRDATIDKMGGLVADAARRGAQIVVFPESFVPAFPIWALVRPPIDQHGLFRRLYEQAVPVPGPHTERMAALARRHGVYLSVGVTERSPVSMGALYNTNLLFDPDGRLLQRHRKLVPTWAEKLIWTGGDGSTLRPIETALGRIGTLICGENTNPLARYALLAQGEQVHLSTYPPAWPFRRGSASGAYARWIELRAGAHSFEGKVCNVVSAAHLDEDAIVQSAEGDESAEAAMREAAPAVSIIIGSGGEVLAGPHSGSEGIVVATVDVGASIENKLAHDVVGNYQRFDLLRLHLDQRTQDPIVLRTDPADALGAEAAAEANGRSFDATLAALDLDDMQP